MQRFLLRGLAIGTLLLACTWMSACSTRMHALQGHQDEPTTPIAESGAVTTRSDLRTPKWQHFTLPGKQPTSYEFTTKDGRRAISVHAVSSASLLRQTVRIDPQDLDHIRFSWKVPELIAQADLAVRENADSPVRIVLAFDGDRSKFSVKNSLLSELSQTLTGEPMPYATLMYVWSNKRAPGSVITSARTDRIRKIVVESGTQNLNQWMDYARNIRADYEKAFGEAPGALVGIGIMTDTDNTRSTARAWYGTVNLASQP